MPVPRARRVRDGRRRVVLRPGAGHGRAGPGGDRAARGGARGRLAGRRVRRPGNVGVRRTRAGPVAERSAHTRAVQSPAFRPGERGLLVTGSDDRTARLWRLPEHGSRHRPVQVREFAGHVDGVHTVAFLDRDTLVTGRLLQIQPLQRLQGRHRRPLPLPGQAERRRPPVPVPWRHPLRPRGRPLGHHLLPRV
ncbi:hypothetical protein ACPCTH_14320 [Streptomyces cellulosae]